MAWNRPNATNQPTVKKGGAKAPSARKGMVAGLVTVCVLGGLCLWLFSDGEATSSSLQKKDRGRIKEVTPAVASSQVVPTNAAPEKPRDPLVTYKPDEVFRDKDGVLKYKSNPNVWAYDPTAKRGKPVILGQANRPSPFKNHAEQEIAALLELTPGEMFYNNTNYSSPSFLQSFTDSLAEKIVISPDDSEDEKELKSAMIEVKKEIVQRMGQGEKLADILNETRREYEKLALYKDDLQQQVRQIVKDGNGSYSNQDIIDCVSAANAMLEEKGIAPIKPTGMVLWNVRLNAERLGASAAEVEAAQDAAEDYLHNVKLKEAK